MESATRESFDVRVTGANGEWDEKYSDRARYIADDLFLHYVAEGFSDRLRKRGRSLLDWIAYIVLGLLAVIVGIFQLNEFIRFLPSDVMDAFQLLNLLSERSQNWFGMGYVPIIGGILALAFIYEDVRIRGIAREARRLQRQLVGAMLDQIFFIQLYPGGGTLRFTYGQNGLFVDGGNLQSRIDWHAFDPASKHLVTVEAKQIPGSLFKAPRRTLDVTWETPIDEATHLILFLKVDPVEDTPFSECLVIPRRRFFESDRNCTPWTEFCEGINKYLR